MRTEEETQKRLEWAYGQHMESLVELQTANRIGNQKKILTARLNAVGLMMEINALEWILETRDNKQSGYEPETTSNS